jgi:hypothetical protein
MNENSIELSPEEPRSVPHSADQNRFPDRYSRRNAPALCRSCNLAAKMLQIGQRPLESPKINPSRRHLMLRTLTTDVHADRADDSLPKELRE